MNTIYRLTTLFALTLLALGADVKFSALPTATSPSTNSYLPIIDLNLLPAAQNQKYLLTNLANATPAGITNALGYTPVNKAGDAFTGPVTRATWWTPTQTNVIVGGVNSVTGGGSLYANSAGNATITFVSPGPCAIRHDTVVSNIYVNISDAGTGAQLKLTHWRRNASTNWTFIEQTSYYSLTSTGQTLFAISPPWTVRTGDTIGGTFNVSSGLAGVTCDTAALYGSLYYAVGDISTNYNFTLTAAKSPQLQVMGVAPFLAITGDSIAEGKNVGAPYWFSFLDITGGGGGFQGLCPFQAQNGEIGYQLKQLIGTDFTYENHAVTGKTFEWVNTNAIAFVNQARSKAVLIHAGVNDVVNSGYTWANVLTNLNSIKAQLTYGQTLFIDEITPNSNATDAQSAIIRNVNLNLATWCSTNNATLIRCHDLFGATKSTTAEPDNLLSIYSMDSVHYAQPGVNKMAELWKAALESKTW